MSLLPRLSVVFLLAGCTGEKPPGGGDTGPSGPVDADGDGSFEDEDCDDGDALRYPGADELCNNLDDDCDGSADEDAVDATTLYADVDGDGAGDADAPLTTCDTPTAYVATADDCDDTDAAISPTATEICDDADVDENCDDLADDADASVDLSTGSTWYADADGDGYGNAAVGTVACDAPAGLVADASDCDDGDAAIHPAGVEVCDDANADEDCNGASDDADDGLDPSTTSTWYEDADGDGYGDPATTLEACDATPGWVDDDTDCDPTSGDVSPGGTEMCDDADVDEDCDGGADNADPGAWGEATWYADTDGDGFGDASVPFSACDLPIGYVADATDCDDAAMQVYPGAPEQCDALVDDCDAIGSWTSTNEIGTASWVDGSGAWTEMTGTLALGTADTPVAFAPTGDGELYLCEGTWYAQIDGSGVALSVVGLNGSGATVVDGGGTGSVVTSTGGTLEVSGVTLRNGSASNGGGLHCLATTLVMDDVVVEANAASVYGGGVFLQSCADAMLTDVSITDNTGPSGAGLYATTSDGLVFDRLDVSENVATVIGGGLSFSNSDFSLTDSTVSDNHSGGSYPGGGISIASSAATLDGVTVSGNAALTGAGVLVSGSTVDMVGGSIDLNSTTSYGAAIYAYNTSAVTFTGTSFSENVAEGVAPVYLDSSATGTFDTCTFTANEGGTAGVLAFGSTSGSVSIVTSDFVDNSPVDVYAGATEYTLGTGASVTCDASTGCL